MVYVHYVEGWVSEQVYADVEVQASAYVEVEAVVLSEDALDDSDVEVEAVVEVLVDSIDHICNIPHPFHPDVSLHTVDQTGLSTSYTGYRSKV